MISIAVVAILCKKAGENDGCLENYYENNKNSTGSECNQTMELLQFIEGYITYHYKNSVLWTEMNTVQNSERMYDE